jgi:hypothetical protein
MMACLRAENFKRNFQISKKEYQTWLKKFRVAAARSGFIRETCLSVAEKTLHFKEEMITA